MAGFASYNKFKTGIENTLSSQAPLGLGSSYGLTYSGIYPFSNASWITEINQGNTPAERNQLLQCASFTSVKEYGGVYAGYASKFFNNISPMINNTQPPSGSWINPRNAIGLNFVGRSSLLVSLTPNQKIFFTPKVTAGGGLTAGGTVSGIVGGGGGTASTGGGSQNNPGGGGVTTTPVGGQVSYPSDVRLKENINKIGMSKSGIPMYEFNYKWSSDRYRGTIAQDLIKLGRLDSVNKNNEGFYMVNYNNLDVEFTKI